MRLRRGAIGRAGGRSALALAALCLGLPGCGDDSSGAGPGTTTVAATGTAPTSIAPTDTQTLSSGTTGPAGTAAAPAGSPLADQQSEIEAQQAKAARKRKQKLARAAALKKKRAVDQSHAGTARRVGTGLLAAMGFQDAKVDGGKSGKTVTVKLSGVAACRADPDTSSVIVDRITETLDFVDKVLVNVTGGQPLRDYVVAHCGDSALPPPAGKVLYTRSGSGPFETRQIKVTSGRWTIDYASGRGFLQVLVVSSNEGLLENSVDADAGEIGKHTFAGPGYFVLKVAGPGRWTVRVRKGH